MFTFTQQTRDKYHFLADERLLGFRFLTEPSNVIAHVDGSALLHCQHALNRANANARLEWRKDGTPISALRSVGRM